MPSGVEFDEDNFGRSQQAAGASPGYQNRSGSGEPKMISWLIKKGIVKSAAAGQVILVIVVLLNIVITYVVLRYFV